MGRYTYNDVKDFIENMTDRDGNSGFKLIATTYNRHDDKLEIICPNGHTFHAQFRHLKNSGSRCPMCSKNKPITFNEVKNFIDSTGYTLLSTEYINAHSKLTVMCQNGHVYDVSFNNFKRGRRCIKCSEKRLEKYTYDEVKQYIESYGYQLLSKEFISVGEKLLMRCPNGHEFSLNFTGFKNEKYRCPKCNMSRGEMEIAHVLNTLGVKYIEQYKFDECKYKRPLPFDFYIPSYSMCIEFDGRQHYMPIFGTEEDLKQRQKLDSIKDEYCASNGIKLLRIPYWEISNIEKIIKEALE